MPDSTALGPAFTVAKAESETCAHPTAAKFAWFARDDTVKSGQVECVVCMACDTLVFVGETPATKHFAKLRTARQKAEAKAAKEQKQEDSRDQSQL